MLTLKMQAFNYLTKVYEAREITSDNDEVSIKTAAENKLKELDFTHYHLIEVYANGNLEWAWEYNMEEVNV